MKRVIVLVLFIIIAFYTCSALADRKVMDSQEICNMYEQGETYGNFVLKNKQINIIGKITRIENTNGSIVIYTHCHGLAEVAINYNIWSYTAYKYKVGQYVETSGIVTGKDLLSIKFQVVPKLKEV